MVYAGDLAVTPYNLLVLFVGAQRVDVICRGLCGIKAMVYAGDSPVTPYIWSTRGA